MADKENVLLNNLAELSKPENFQRFILGTKGNGQYRALYDVVKDYTRPKKKGKKHNKQNINGYQLLLTTKKHKKKKKKHKKNRDKYWHV